MVKLVLNGCYGGFSLSGAAISRYGEIKGLNLIEKPTRFGGSGFYFVDGLGDERRFPDRDLARDDLALVQVVEELGEAANGAFARLYVTEIPTGAQYRIEEYDGSESAMTIDDYDWSIA